MVPPRQPRQPDESVLQSPRLDLPDRVVRVGDRAGEAETGPEQTGEADDAGHAAAALGGPPGQAEVLDDPLGEVVGPGREEPDHRDPHQRASK